MAGRGDRHEEVSDINRNVMPAEAGTQTAIITISAANWLDPGLRRDDVEERVKRRRPDEFVILGLGPRIHREQALAVKWILGMKPRMTMVRR